MKNVFLALALLATVTLNLGVWFQDSLSVQIINSLLGTALVCYAYLLCFKGDEIRPFVMKTLLKLSIPNMWMVILITVSIGVCPLILMVVGGHHLTVNLFIPLLLVGFLLTRTIQSCIDEVLAK